MTQKRSPPDDTAQALTDAYFSPENEYQSWNRAQAVNSLAHDIHLNAHTKGFYDVTRGMTTDALTIFLLSRIALIHSELSEALEAARRPSRPDTHCPQFSNWDIELADTVIRILGLAAFSHVNIGEAIEAKHAYNTTRPFMHGKNS